MVISHFWEPGRMSRDWVSWHRRTCCCLNNNFNLDFNLKTMWDWALVLHMCIPVTKPFGWYHKFWPSPWTLTYFRKTLTLSITFIPEEIGLLNCTRDFLVTRPFRWHHNFWADNLDFEITRSLTLVSFERVLWVEDACQTWSLYLLWFKSYS